MPARRSLVLFLRPRRSVCRAQALSVSGPAPRRFEYRGPALSVSGPGARWVGPCRSFVACSRFRQFSFSLWRVPSFFLYLSARSRLWHFLTLLVGFRRSQPRVPGPALPARRSLRPALYRDLSGPGILPLLSISGPQYSLSLHPSGPQAFANNIKYIPLMNIYIYMKSFSKFDLFHI